MLPTNVLIIDDSKLITKIVAKALLTNSIENHYFVQENIFIAHDGMDAFEILGKNHNITLVISDVMMPILNGEELIEMLIDIDRINSLDLFFITTPNIAKSMSSISKEYSVGIVSKPFNNITFCEQINNLHLIYQKKIQIQKQIKLIHDKQKRHIIIWLNDYFRQKKLSISMDIFNLLIEPEFKHYNAIDKDELFMILNSVVEDYFFETKEDTIVDVLLLQDIYNSWYKPEEYGKLGLEEDFQTIINNAKGILDKSSVKEEIIYAITQPIHHAISKVIRKSKNNATLVYNDFYPYFSDLLEFFYTIDDNFQKKRISTLLEHIDEIQKVQSHIDLYLSDSKLIATFPFLNENSEIIDILKNNFEEFSSLIHNKIIPSYIYETDYLLWNQAKKSPKIVHFLKENLKQKMPNTHNLLHYLNKISKEEMKRFTKYDRLKVSVISSERELLALFKNKLVEHLPLWELSIYTSASMLQGNVGKTKYTKLIIDLNFQDTVFNNGLQLFNYLHKKIPYIQEIVDNNGIYFLATAKQIEVLHNKKYTINYNIVLKPLNEKNIYQKIFWES